MGIRIASTTWRTPLQLIDSWLPKPVQLGGTRRTFSPVLQRFSLAGWLGKTALPFDHPPQSSTPHILPNCPASVRTAPLHKLRATKVVRGQTRLVISGRMADVCAELDRLAALEQQPVAAA